MILKIYLFAQSAGTYQQYTSDYSETFLKSVCKNCKTDNQIAIHRDGNLIYYAYAHKVNNSEISGICVVCGEVCLNVKALYDFLLKTLEYHARKGVLFHYDNQGRIRKRLESLASEPAEIDGLFRDVKQNLDKRTSFWEPLPPEDLTIPIAGSISLSFSEDGESKLIDAIRHYHNVYIALQSTAPSSYSQTVARLNKDNSNLRSEITTLKDDISKLRHKQRNTLWVSILSSVVVLMGLIIYFKVINPSQVSKYQTKEFVYYGPLNHKKPHGEGVAFYPDDDHFGRRYYIGTFVKGERQDTAAMLYYKDGDYFYGAMKGDQWEKGVYYSNSNNSHFVGSFVNNIPDDGTWYRHDEAYKVKDGKPVN